MGPLVEKLKGLQPPLRTQGLVPGTMAVNHRARPLIESCTAVKIWHLALRPPVSFSNRLIIS